MAGLLYRLGRFSARRHWLVIIAWIVIMGIAGLTFSLFQGSISSSITIPNTKTSQVQDELADKFPSANGGNGTIVFQTTDGKAFTDTQKADVKSFLDGLKDLDGVKGVRDGFATQDQLDEQRQKITDGRKQIEDGRAQITSGQQQLDQQKAQLESGKQQIATAQQELDAKEAQAAAAGGAAATAAQAQLAQAQAQIDAQQQQITAGEQQITQAQQQIDENTKKLDTSEQELEQGSDLLDLSKDIRFVSSNGQSSIGTVQFTKSTYEVPQETKQAISDKAESAKIDGVAVYVSNDIAQGVPSILGPGEIVGVIIAALVLFLMLRTIIGAAIPLLSAVLGVGIASLASLSFSSLVEFISVTPVLGVMLGLAVGIDYSLFILNRHRTQLKAGMDVHESIGLANGTSGNAVVFAGTTVIVALLALNITGIPFLGLMGTVGAVAVLFAILIATSFTPALLSLLGMRILRRKERQRIGTRARSGCRTSRCRPGARSSRSSPASSCSAWSRSRRRRCASACPRVRPSPSTRASTRRTRRSTATSAPDRTARCSSSPTCRSPCRRTTSPHERSPSAKRSRRTPTCRPCCRSAPRRTATSSPSR